LARNAGTATDPTVAAVATLELEHAAKTLQAAMLLWRRPPGIGLSHLESALYMRSLMPLRNSNSPISANSGAAIRLNARRHQEFPLARLAARMGHVARDGRYHDGGTPGARSVEVRRDGTALRALRAGAIAGGGRQTGYIFVYTAEERNTGTGASY
jgi:hypothetical protein